MMKHTHRQYLAWQEWLDQQWNRPDRHDAYAMLIAAEVRRGHAKNPRSVKMSDLELTFKDRSDKPAVTKEQAQAWSKAAWLGRMTMPVKEV